MNLVLPLQLASFMLALGLTAYIIGLAAVGQRNADFREVFAETMRDEFGWIDDVIWFVSDTSWIPAPWSSAHSRLEILMAMGQGHAQALQSLTPPDADDPDAWPSFTRYFDGWATQKRYCTYLQLQLPNVPPTLCADFEQVRAPWGQLFRERFAAERFINLRYGYPIAGERPTRTVEVCNLAPFPVRFAQAEDLASPSVIEFYRETVDLPEYRYRIAGWDDLAAGACTILSVRGIDRTPEVFVHSRPADPAFTSWFTETWAKYYAPELLTDEFRASLAAELERFTGGHVCTSEAAFETKTDDPSDCTADSVPQPYLSGYLVNGGLFFAMTYPGFADYASVLNQSGVDRVRLANATHEAEKRHGIARQYRDRQPRRVGRQQRFVLGAELDDQNGPFFEGILANGIPAETIEGDYVDIPPAGVILEINQQEIYSLEDVYEALELHGGSRLAGIEKLLYVKLFDGEIEQHYPASFRFNPLATQEFDTKDVGFLNGLVESVSFNSESTVCRVKGWFADVNRSECSWLAAQRNAYARQVEPNAFQFGDLVGLGAMPGIVAKVAKPLLRVIGFGRKARWLTPIARMGVYATVDGVHEYAMASPYMPLDEKLREVQTAVAFGLVFGALDLPNIKK